MHGDDVASIGIGKIWSKAVNCLSFGGLLTKGGAASDNHIMIWLMFNCIAIRGTTKDAADTFRTLWKPIGEDDAAKEIGTAPVVKDVDVAAAAAEISDDDARQFVYQVFGPHLNRVDMKVLLKAAIAKKNADLKKEAEKWSSWVVQAANAKKSKAEFGEKWSCQKRQFQQPQLSLSLKKQKTSA